MVSRLSLYFEPYVWEKLNRYLSYLLLSGKPSYELPSMNDLIEGITVFVSGEFARSDTSDEYFLSFMDEGSLKKTRTNNLLERGRIAFNFTTRTQDALTRIRSSIATTTTGLSVTDPMLIRTCVHYVVFSGAAQWDFYMQTYVLFLYNLRPGLLSFVPKDFEKEIVYFSETEKQNLRKIVWDDSTVTQLQYDDDSFLTVSTLRKYIKDPGFDSKGFAFNYAAAHTGAQLMMHGMMEETPLPELLLSRGEDIVDPQYFDMFRDYVTKIFDIAKKFNSGVYTTTKQE